MQCRALSRVHTAFIAVFREPIARDVSWFNHARFNKKPGDYKFHSYDEWAQMQLEIFKARNPDQRGGARRELAAAPRIMHERRVFDGRGALPARGGGGGAERERDRDRESERSGGRDRDNDKERESQRERERERERERDAESDPESARARERESATRTQTTSDQGAGGRGDAECVCRGAGGKGAGMGMKGSLFWGLYAKNLDRWWRTWGKGQTLVLSYDTILANTSDTMQASRTRLCSRLRPVPSAPSSPALCDPRG
eukprot:23521-Rhodomonas_salina.2